MRAPQLMQKLALSGLLLPHAGQKIRACASRMGSPGAAVLCPAAKGVHKDIRQPMTSTPGIHFFTAFSFEKTCIDVKKQGFAANGRAIKNSF